MFDILSEFYNYTGYSICTKNKLHFKKTFFTNHKIAQKSHFIGVIYSIQPLCTM